MRLTPLTGANGFRLLAEKYGQIKPNEIHGTDDQFRFFLEGRRIGPSIYHGKVPTTLDMLNLFDSSGRGCFIGDTCYNKELGCLMICVAGDGTEETDWEAQTNANVIIEAGDIAIGDLDGNPIRLPAGLIDGHVLRMKAGLPEWGNPLPIEEQGDLIVGDADGNAIRLEQPDPDGNYFVLLTLGKGNDPTWMDYDPVPNILIDHGDMLFYYDDGKLAAYDRIPIGNPGMVMTVAITDIPSWAAPTPMTTKGDMMYAGDSSSPVVTLTRVGIGTTGQVWTVQGSGVPGWSNPTGGSGGADFLTVQVFS